MQGVLFRDETDSYKSISKTLPTALQSLIDEWSMTSWQNKERGEFVD